MGDKIIKGISIFAIVFAVGCAVCGLWYFEVKYPLIEHVTG